MCKFKAGDWYHKHSIHITQIKLHLEKPLKNKTSEQIKAVPFEREQRQEYSNFLRRAIFSPSPLVLDPCLSTQLSFCHFPCVVSVFLTASRNLSLLLLFHSPSSYLFSPRFCCL